MKLLQNTFKFGGLALIVAVILIACGSEENSPGVEYMPDMYRSPAIETYVDYSYPDSSTVRQAPEHSIPKGYKPYAYPNTNEGYEMAGENLANPLDLEEKTLARGKELYTSFCAHCHGKNGKGQGSIQHPIYGAVPSYSDETPNRRGDRSMSELKEGHIYHAIMYGLNAMGPHSSLIREEDRWKIVAYVQKLQGKDPLSKQSDENAMAMNATDSTTTNEIKE